MSKNATIKTVIARVPYDLWRYVKVYSCDNDISMSRIVIESLNKFKNDKEKKLQK
jgi:hypothetical protein